MVNVCRSVSALVWFLLPPGPQLWPWPPGRRLHVTQALASKFAASDDIVEGGLIAPECMGIRL